jgi:hypothetical protein
VLRSTGAFASAKARGISNASTFRMSTSVSRIVVGRCCVISSVGQTRSMSAARAPVGMITRSAASTAASIAGATPGGLSTRTSSPGSLDSTRTPAAVPGLTSNGNGVPRCAARSAHDDADPCGSASTTRTGTPRRTPAAAKNIAVVVFPTPPLVCTSDQITALQHPPRDAHMCAGNQTTQKCRRHLILSRQRNCVVELAAAASACRIANSIPLKFEVAADKASDCASTKGTCAAPITTGETGHQEKLPDSSEIRGIPDVSQASTHNGKFTGRHLVTTFVPTTGRRLDE